MRTETSETNRRQRLAPELLEHELNLAREVQESLLTVDLPALHGVRVAAANRPARIVSGDLYDVIAIDENRMVILCADVSGKGFGAALLAAEVQSYFRAMLQAASVVRTLLESASDSVLIRKFGPLTSHIVTQMNRTVCRHLNLRGRYATLFFAELDARDGTLQYVNAGHNPALLLVPGRPVRLLSAGGPPVGLFEDAAYETERVVLPPRGTLLVYTDGVTETSNRDDEELGLPRLIELCAGATGDADYLLAHILGAAERWSGGLEATDDITLVVVGRDG